MEGPRGKERHELGTKETGGEAELFPSRLEAGKSPSAANGNVKGEGGKKKKKGWGGDILRRNVN